VLLFVLEEIEEGLSDFGARHGGGGFHHE
jgi:hypothetical protein